MNFGQALEIVKSGGMAAREGWNGKGMWITLSSGKVDLQSDSFWSPNNRKFAESNGGSATVQPCVSMKTAANEIQLGWLASQSDMLAEDWVEVNFN